MSNLYQEIQNAIANYARDILTAGQQEERERILRLLENAYLESRNEAHPLMTRAYAFEQIIKIVKEGCND